MTDNENTSAVVVIEDVEAPNYNNGERAVTVSNPVWDIGSLSADEFEARKAMLTAGTKRIADLQRSILIEDTEGKGRNGDWGKIPGVERAIIYKSGAEKLANFYRLVPEFVVEREEREATDLGFPRDAHRPNRINYTVLTKMHAGSHDGPVVGEGVGVASSWEKKYLFRTGQRLCPGCNKPTLKMGDKRDGSGKEWYCWKRLDPDACGKRFEINDPQISAGAAEVLNMEPWDLENTLIKIAKKRSHVDATLTTLGASALFAQDLEESEPHQSEAASSAGPLPVREGAPRSSGGRAAPTGGDGPPESPAAAYFEGVIGEQLPDQVREKKRPDWYDVIPEGQTIATLELRFEIGGKKHTAYVLGDAAYAVRAAELQTGDRVRTNGELHMVEWQAGKPKMRQIWWVTIVEVERDGKWVRADDPDVDVTAQAAAIFEDEAGEDIQDGQPGVAAPPDPLKLPRAEGINGGTFDGHLDLIDVTHGQQGDTKFAQLRLTDYENLYVALMTDEDAQACRVDDLAGKEVQIAGGWQLLNSGWVLVTGSVAA